MRRVLLSLLLLLASLGAGGRAYEVAELVEGRLGAEAANRYTVDVSGVLVVALLTEEGDADLYVSTVTKEPNYLDYQYYSASCGLDLVVVPTSKGAESQRVYLSVVGHSHHAESQYKLAIITASFQDISKFQVWELDPETGREYLLVNYDLLEIANDPILHRLLEQLQGNAAGGSSEGVWSRLQYIAEWGFYLFFEALKIMIEIVV